MIGFNRLISALCLAAVMCACTPFVAWGQNTYQNAYPFGDYYANPRTPDNLGPIAASQASAIADFQTQVLDVTVHGMGQGQNDNALPGAFPTGRLKETWHDGYKSLLPNHDNTDAFRTAEASAFGSALYKLPGSYLSGELQVGAFVGYNEFYLKYDTSGAKANNEAALFGGYGLYTAGPNYIMVTTAGAEGTTHQNDGVLTSYDTQGFFASFVGGHVHELDNAGSLKVDVRGGVSYAGAYGNHYTNSASEMISTSFDGWTGSLSATLFSNISLSGGALCRPYIKGEIHEQFSYNNTVKDDTASTDFEFGQSGTVGLAEVGLDYALPSVTFNAAIYGEAASDRAAVGGRLGAKFKLN